MSPVIDVRGIGHSFGEGKQRKQVLFDVDLAIGPGQLTVLSGPSGSGKTTLLTLIGGLRSIQEGQATVLGRALAGLSQTQLVRHRRDLGFIFQLHNLFPELTATQNVQVALDLLPLSRQEKRKRVSDLLGELGLSHRMHAKPQQLSAGQCQRVAIARALVHRPQVILADEPTAALDSGTSRDVVDLLTRRVREQDASILMVTHDNRIFDAADRILRMVDGRLASDVLVSELVDTCRFLRGCEPFSMYTPGELAEIAQRIVRKQLASGEALTLRSAAREDLYVVKSGAAHVRLGDSQEARNTIGELAARSCFGSSAEEFPEGSQVVAQEALELFVIARGDLAGVRGAQSFESQLMSAIYGRSD